MPLLRRALLLASLAFALPGAALAQAWPTQQPIKLVAVFPPGDVPLAVGSVFLSKPHIDSGKLRALAVTTSQRSANQPGVPTVADKLSAQGIVVNTGTAAAAQAFIAQQIDTWAKVVKANDIKAE
jgi:tripartite-type tricarboxylate transporter receptor subunit TctC